MTTTVNPFECDYLGLDTPTAPYVFVGKWEEIDQINQKVSLLDTHISQLFTLRRALHRRSRQLHNLLSPIYALPTEVLSCIFQLVINPGNYNGLDLPEFRKCLLQAFVLSSVSAHLRHVALGTPELWESIPLLMLDHREIGNLSSLLQHCTALANNLNLSIFDALDKEGASLAIETLLTPDTMRKIKAFQLGGSDRATNLWIDKLKDSSTPRLNALSIVYRTRALSLDLGTLDTVTRITMHGPCMNCPTILPSSVRYLNLINIPQQMLISLLYQCPNLVECFIAVTRHLPYSNHRAQFNNPLTLAHLKHLTFHALNAITTASSAQNLRLPALESLHLEVTKNSKFIGVVLLCQRVSSTLTTLNIYTDSNELQYDDLYQLCGLPFPKLRKLEFSAAYREPLLSAIRAMTQRAGEDDNTEPHYLPSLRTLTVHSDSRLETRCLLDLLNKWRVGEASYFHVKITCPPRDSPPDLPEELKSIVGSRQIEVSWNHSKILQLARIDGLLQDDIVD